MRVRRVPPINCVQFGLLLALCIASYIWPGRLLISIFLLMLVICIGDGIYFFIAKRSLRLNISEGIPVEKHELFTLFIRIENTGFLPSPLFSLKAKDTMRLMVREKKEVKVLLKPKETLKYKIIFEAMLSGEDIAGIEWGMLESYFGFFKVKLPLEMYVKARILPEVRAIRGIDYFSEQLPGYANNEKHGDVEIQKRAGEEIGYELKPYVEGDTQRLIHWKIAALKDIYLVRQREDLLEHKEDIFFIVNPLQSEEDEGRSAIIQDKTATSLVSLANYFLGKGQTVKVACYIHKGWKYMKYEKASQIRELQEMLSRYHSLEVSTEVDELMIIRSLTNIMKKHGGIRIILSAYWHEMMMHLMTQQQEGQSTIPMVWTGEKVPDNMSEGEQITIWHMQEAYELEKIR